TQAFRCSRAAVQSCRSSACWASRKCERAQKYQPPLYPAQLRSTASKTRAPRVSRGCRCFHAVNLDPPFNTLPHQSQSSLRSVVFLSITTSTFEFLALYLSKKSAMALDRGSFLPFIIASCSLTVLGRGRIETWCLPTRAPSWSRS